MSFFGAIITNYVGQLIGSLSMLYIAYTLLDKKLRLTKRLVLSYPIFMLGYYSAGRCDNTP
jgi:hypothetical protein